MGMKRRKKPINGWVAQKAVIDAALGQCPDQPREAVALLIGVATRMAYAVDMSPNDVVGLAVANIEQLMHDDQPSRWAWYAGRTLGEERETE